MKTTTIRVDDDLMELIDKVAELTGRHSSEVMRAGIREYMRACAYVHRTWDGDEGH